MVYCTKKQDIDERKMVLEVLVNNRFRLKMLIGCLSQILMSQILIRRYCTL